MSLNMPGAQLPRVRSDLEFIPISYEQQQLVLVRDHLGLVAEGQALHSQIFKLLQVLDSTRNADALREAMTQTMQGHLITQAEVLAFINELDAAYLLHSQHFTDAYNELVNSFAAAHIRHCALCGSAYPEETDELSSWIEAILAEPSEAKKQTPEPKALIAPHIDPQAGARVYASAYARLANLRPERIIILGVGHQLADGLFCVTDKSFATPLGSVPSDTGAVAAIRSAGDVRPGCMSTTDFCHRSEHSIEFQVLFLQHLLPEGSFSIVPVLCGSPQLHLREYSHSAFVRYCAPVLDVLATLAKDPKTLVISGVDLSHIGLKFGHEQTAQELESETTVHDSKLLQCLAAGDAEAFWDESKRVNDRYNVCGFSALATLLEMLPGATGHFLDYALWHEEPTQSGVSFAAMTLA